MRTHSLLLSTVFLSSLAAPALASPRIDLELIAVSGQPAPGLPLGVTFSDFNGMPPALDDSGHLTFASAIEGPGVIAGINDRAVWSDLSGTLTLLARAGHHAPGTGFGVDFAQIAPPLLDERGHVAFLATLQGPGVDSSNQVGIWTTRAGTLTRLVRGGQAAHGIPGAVYYSIQDVVFGTEGHVAFIASIDAPGLPTADKGGLWVAPDETPILVARGGQPAPGTPFGTRFAWVQLESEPVVNGAGDVAFQGRLQGTGVGPANDTGLWLWRGGRLSLVAREGQAAPGLAPGHTFGSIEWRPGIDDAGDTAFISWLHHGNQTFAASWVKRAGQPLAPLFVAGDHAPGTASSTAFSSFGRPSFDCSGAITMTGRLAGPGVDYSNDQGLWRQEPDGSTGLWLRTGRRAPGTPAGVTFRYFSEPVINCAGEMAVTGQLVGPGVDIEHEYGVWMVDPQTPSNPLVKVVVAGDLIELSPNDTRRVVYAHTQAGGADQDGRRTTLNDLGQVTVWVIFDDDSVAIFRASLKPPVGSVVARQ